MIIRSWNWQAKQACRIQQSDLQNKQTSKQNLPMKKTILPLIIGAGMALGTASAPAALLVHFSFDQATIADDGVNQTIFAGTGSNGTIEANAGDTGNKAVAGKFGNALSLDGNDFADLSANVSSIGSLSVGSIAFWFNMPSTSGFGTFVSGSDASDIDSEIRVFPWDATGRLAYESRDGGTTLFREITPSGGGFNDSTWHHITAISTGSDIELYVNGTKQGVQSAGGEGFFGDVTDLDTLLVGAGRGTGNKWFYTGLIDDLGIYDHALSQAEITALQTNAIPEPSAAGLVALAALSTLLLRRRSR
jgi:hypothetical protein